MNCFLRSSESARYHQKTPVKLPGIVLNDIAKCPYVHKPMAECSGDPKHLDILVIS